jgi:hypothetical protein
VPAGRNVNAALLAPARTADARFGAAGRPQHVEQTGGIFNVSISLNRSHLATAMFRKLLRVLPFIGLASLEDVVRHYAIAPQASDGHNKLKPVPLSKSEILDLVAFFETLSERTARKSTPE